MTSSLIPSDKAIPVKRLTEFREHLELSKVAMAKRLGLSRQWLINMENGRVLPGPCVMTKLDDLSLGFLTPNDFFPFIENGEYKTPTNKRIVPDSLIADTEHLPFCVKHFRHWRKECEPKRTYQQVADLLGARSHQMIQAWEKGVSLPRSHAMMLKIYEASEGRVTPDTMILNEAFDIPRLDFVGEMHQHFMSMTHAKGS